MTGVPARKWNQYIASAMKLIETDGRIALHAQQQVPWVACGSPFSISSTAALHIFLSQFQLIFQLIATVSPALELRQDAFHWNRLELQYELPEYDMFSRKDLIETE